MVAPPMHKQLHSESYAIFMALLREIRESKRVSQETLALRLGVHQSFVSKVETGHRRLDAVELLEWLRALQAHPEVFIRTLGSVWKPPAARYFCFPAPRVSRRQSGPGAARRADAAASFRVRETGLAAHIPTDQQPPPLRMRGDGDGCAPPVAPLRVLPWICGQLGWAGLRRPFLALR